MEDPVEKIVADALVSANVLYRRDQEVFYPTQNRNRSIDFYLPDFDLWIEVCQFYTPRKLEQLAVLQDAILIQGKGAALTFAKLLKR